MHELLEALTDRQQQRLLSFLDTYGGKHAITDIELEAAHNGQYSITVQMRNGEQYAFSQPVASYLMTDCDGQQLCGMLLHDLIGYAASEVEKRLRKLVPKVTCLLIFCPTPRLYQ